MSTENAELMDRAKEAIKEEVSPIAYMTWIQYLDIVDIDDAQIILGVNDPVKKDFLDAKYMDLITNTFTVLTKIERPVTIIATNELSKKQEPGGFSAFNDISKNINVQQRGNSLRADYTFETFIVGDNNNLAHAAAVGIVENPGNKMYNPLFIYGGAGLGKTHLMHAIGNEILKRDKNKKVIYITSETFTNEFINSIKEQRGEEFRNKYRNIDVLLIDDIQFIATKDKSREEFFHTFNTLHEIGSQIVLSSDKPPKEIPLLEERLKSRFEWGLIADISSPDFETRVAILRKKAELQNIIIDTEILYNIATKIDSNIRELEGVLNKVTAYSSLIPGPITIETAEKAINEIILKKEQIISNEYIQEIVANYFNIEKRDLKSSKRSNDIAYPRQIAMYLCRSIANSSLKQIGDDFGKRDHTTVMHAVKKIEEDLKENKNTKLIVESVKKIIFNKE